MASVCSGDRELREQATLSGVEGSDGPVEGRLGLAPLSRRNLTKARWAFGRVFANGERRAQIRGVKPRWLGLLMGILWPWR